MAEITVKHYRRAHAGARDKELVVERVTEGSETGLFLHKMEEKRIRKPCFETIDMRGKVPAECQRYMLHNREFYLDDTSYGLYQEGLKSYSGMFTVGTYEAIVNGSHTNRAMRDAQNARELAAQRKNQQERVTTAATRATAAGAQESPGSTGREVAAELYQPELIPLGYFKRRCEERLQYVTTVQIQANGQTYNGTTRDLSVGGLQIVLKGIYRFVAGAEMQIGFPALQEQEPRLALTHLRYRIVASEQRDVECYLRVQLLADSAPDGFAAFIGELITRYKHKYKLDVEDDYWSVCSWLYERLYSESEMQLAFFASRDQDGLLSTQAVAVTNGNQPFAHFFRNDVDNYDFSSLCLPDRLQHLSEHRECLLLLYREKVGNEYRLHSVTDFELKDAHELQNMLRFTLAHEEHCVAKVIISNVPMQPISPSKFDMLAVRLQEKSESEVTALRDRVAGLYFAATVIDITTQMRSAFDVFTGTERGQIDVEGVKCWVGGARVQLPLYTEIERLAVMPAPELIRFGYVERRREDRYLAETAVEINAHTGKMKGRTRDISKRGLSIRLEQPLAVSVGDEIKVALISLQAKRPSLDLSKVLYRVVKIDARDGTTTLMLERMRDKFEHEIDDFFVELITKNRHKLVVDVNDTRGATLSRIYEGTAAENAGTLPFFIARREEGGGQLQAVAIPEGKCALAEFFRDAPVQSGGQLDFAWLSESRLVLALYQQMGQMAREAAQQQQRPSPIEIEVYAYRQATGLRVATEFEFTDDTQREAFLAAALAAPEHRIFKLMATYTLEFNKADLDGAIESIRNQSRHRAGKLHEQISAVLGYGEIIDITAQYLRGRELARM
ncbi:MAG: PilZ domain-containing protein [Gammaproteobacteria bacterium]|nr:PilZ domain-containing protein [Gammaproteobacteria bacterium]